MPGPVAFVTGASRGIGRQLAIDFARSGYDVVCLARSTADHPTRLPGTVDETAEQVRAAGRRALPLGVDLQHDDQIVAAAERAYAEFGRVDVLINNAGIAPSGKALEQPTRRWRLAVDINLNAPYSLIAAVVPRMLKAGGGRVMNVSSGAATNPAFGRASYSTTKRALEVMTESLAHDLRGSGIALNAIRLDAGVWTEGYAYTLPGVDTRDFEDPVIMSDVCLWLAQQPLEYSGHVLTIGELRRNGVVRPRTRIGDAASPNHARWLAMPATERG